MYPTGNHFLCPRVHQHGSNPKAQECEWKHSQFYPNSGITGSKANSLCLLFTNSFRAFCQRLWHLPVGDSLSSRSNSSQVLALHTGVPQPLDTGISSAGSSVSPTHQLPSLSEPETTKTLQGQAPHSPGCNKQRQFSCPPTCVHHWTSSSWALQGKTPDLASTFPLSTPYQKSLTPASPGNITPNRPWTLSCRSIVWHLPSFWRGITTLWHLKWVKKLKGESQHTESTKITFKDIIFERADKSKFNDFE